MLRCRSAMKAVMTRDADTTLEPEPTPLVTVAPPLQQAVREETDRRAHTEQPRHRPERRARSRAAARRAARWPRSVPGAGAPAPWWLRTPPAPPTRRAARQAPRRRATDVAPAPRLPLARSPGRREDRGDWI